LAAGLDEEPEYFLNRAFEKIWGVITPQKFAEFPDLKSVLRYLQLCVHSVIIDYARARERAELLAEDSEPERLAFSDEEPDDNGVENKVSSRLQGREVWDGLSQRLKTEQERVLVFALFVLALKPREVFEAYPGAFSSIDEVYMVKENLLSRLRRDKGLLHALRNVEETPSQNESKSSVKSGDWVPSDAGNMRPTSVYKGR
jgi:hypothetical protein